MIRDQISIEQMLEWLGYQTGSGGFTECPGHLDSHPSLKVYGGDRGFFCFQCNKGGGPVEFYKLEKKCSTKEAIKAISQHFGLKDDFADRVKAIVALPSLRVQNDRWEEMIDQWDREVCSRFWNVVKQAPEYMSIALMNRWRRISEVIDWVSGISRSTQSITVLYKIEEEVFKEINKIIQWEFAWHERNRLKIVA